MIGRELVHSTRQRLLLKRTWNRKRGNIEHAKGREREREMNRGRGREGNVARERKE